MHPTGEAQDGEVTLRPPPLSLALLLAALGVPAALLLGLLSGSAGWGWPASDILWLIRVPRVLAAFGTGAALALSGALIQLVTRNPLGDPHVLGVTSGASVGALLALMLTPAGWLFAPEIGATLGALGAMSLVFRAGLAQPGSQCAGHTTGYGRCAAGRRDDRRSL